MGRRGVVPPGDDLGHIGNGGHAPGADVDGLSRGAVPVQCGQDRVPDVIDKHKVPDDLPILVQGNGLPGLGHAHKQGHNARVCVDQGLPRTVHILQPDDFHLGAGGAAPGLEQVLLAQLGGGHVVEKPEILFQRLDLEEVMKKVEELHPKVKEEKEEEEEGIDIEAKPEITFEDFEKMQFQVGEIISCEAVKKSKKLLCSQVKIGSQVKQIVSGIKAHYTPEEMVGKKVMVLVNLKPAKLAGVLSEGMLLCAEDAEGNLALMTPEKKMPAGAEIC